MPADPSCPDPDALARLLRGESPADEADALEAHLSTCRSCERTAEGLAAGSLDELVRRAAAAAVPVGPRLRAVIDRARRAADEASSGGTVPMPGPPGLTAGGPPSQPPAPDPAAEPTRDDYAFLAPPEAPGELGRLGGHRVLRVLGRGGMGVVFEAEDVRLGRRVALKVMRPEMLERPTARERFLREARAAAAVEDDHVVAIHQVGEDRGVLFLAMPMLKGESLEDRLKRDPRLPLPELLRVAGEAAAGLAAAHARGLVHRDIKPANVWVEAPSGRVKVLDFGLARAAERGGDLGPGLTHEGGVLGTPSYMSPEQAHGLPVDARTDLFSLGVMLYRCATGVLPFRGRDTLSTLMAVSTETPPAPSAVNPELPAGVSALIVHLLAKEAGDRPASAAEVVAAVRELERPPAPAAAPARPRRAWGVAVAAGVLAVLAAVAGVVVITIRRGNEPATTVEVPTGSRVKIDGAGGIEVTVPAAAAVADDPAERAAAATVLATGKFHLDLRTTAAGGPTMVGPGAALPARPFAVVGVRAAAPAVTDDDLAAVAALPRLETLLLLGCREVTDRGVRPLAGLRGLRGLWLGNTAVGPAAVDVVRANPGLESLGLGVAASPTGPLGDAALDAVAAGPDLRGVELPPGATTAGLSRLAARCPNLERVRVQKAADADPSALAGLRLLREVQCRGEQLTRDGVAALARIPTLDRVLIDTPVPAAGVAGLKPLAGKLRTLAVADGPAAATAAVWPALAALTGVERLRVESGSVTLDPAALAALAGMPNLRRLEIVLTDKAAATCTDADFAAFRRARQDVGFAFAHGDRAVRYPRLVAWPGKEAGQPDAAWGLPKDAPPPAVVPFPDADAKAHQERWAAHLKVPVEVTAAGGVKLRLIPPGEFDTTFPADNARPAGGPAARLRVPAAFYLGTTEVTVGQFRAFADATGYRTESERGGVLREETFPGEPTWKEPGHPADAERPVTCLTAADLRAYCDWLGARDGAVYRLPTEAEWEWAALAGRAGPWAYGKAWDELEPYAWLSDTVPPGPPGPRLVGRKRANPFGLTDTLGNVWEACLSSGRGDAPTAVNPFAGGTVLRGGCAQFEKSPVGPRHWWGENAYVRPSAGFRVLRQTTPAPLPPPPPWTPFAGPDGLAGWSPWSNARWEVADGELVGTPGAGAGGDGGLRSVRQFTDVEVSFRVRLSPRLRADLALGIHPQAGGDGVGRFYFSGPQPLFADDGRGHGAAPAAAAAKAIRPNEFNDVTVRYAGRRLSLTVNGVVAFRDVPTRGGFGSLDWCVHADSEPLRVRDVRVTDLSWPPAAAPTPAPAAGSPGPFDALRREDIPADELARAGGGDPAQAPPQLVAVLRDGPPGDRPGVHRAVVVSPDGRRVAAVADGAVTVWDVATRAVARRLTDPPDATAARWTPDGTALAVGSARSAAGVWDVATGERRAAVAPPAGAAVGACSDIAVSRDGSLLAVAWSQDVVQVCDAATGREVGRVRGPAGADNWKPKVAFAPDGRLAVAGEAAGGVLELSLVDPRTGAAAWTVRPGGRVALSLRVTADGRRVVGRFGPHAAAGTWVRDAATGAEVWARPGLVVSGVTADGRRLFARTGDDRGLYDLETAAGVGPWLAWRGPQPQMADLAPDDRHVVFVAADGALHVHRLAAAAAAPPKADPPAPVSAFDLGAWEVVGPKVWSVAGGVLSADGAGGRVGWLATRAAYTDFALDLEYRLPPGGNSGVFLRAWKDAPESGAAFVEVQLHDDGTGDVWRTGAVYKRIAPDPRPEAPVGRWNRLGVRVVGKRVTVTVNGTRCVDGDVEFPRPTGAVGLQVFRTGVEFRGVRLTDLGRPAPPTPPAVPPPAAGPGPFDALRREDIPAEELARAGGGNPADAPKQLVAVFGSSAMRHDGRVTAVAADPAGKWLASAGRDGFVRVWDAATGRAVRAFPAWVGNDVVPLAVTAGGRLAVPHPDGGVRVYDPTTGTEGRRLADQRKIAVVASDPAGKRLATAEQNGTEAGVVDIDSGKLLFRTASRGMAILAVAFRPDGSQVATACKDGVVRVFDGRTGGLVAELTGHTGPVVALAFDPAGRRLASAGDDTLRVWDAATWRPTTLITLPFLAPCVGFTPDGERVVGAEPEGRVQSWDAATGAELAPLTRRERGESADDPLAGTRTSCLTFTSGGTRLVTGGDDNAVRLWDAATGERVPVGGRDGRATGLDVSPDGRQAAAHHNGAVVVWDVARREVVCRLTDNLPTYGSVVHFSPDGATLAATTWRGHGCVWDARTGRKRFDLSRWAAKPPRTMGDIAFSPGGDTLAVTVPGGKPAVALVECRTGTQVGHVPVPSKANSPDCGIVRVAFRPDGLLTLLTGAYAHRGGTLSVVDPKTGSPAWSVTSDTSTPYRVFATARGRVVASAEAAAGPGAWLWDAGTGAAVWSRPGLGAAAVSPDGRRLLGRVGNDRGLFDAETGKPAGEAFARSNVPTTGGAFAPDGRHVLVSAEGGTIQVYRLAPPP